MLRDVICDLFPPINHQLQVDRVGFYFPFFGGFNWLFIRALFCRLCHDRVKHVLRCVGMQEVGVVGEDFATMSVSSQGGMRNSSIKKGEKHVYV